MVRKCLIGLAFALASSSLMAQDDQDAEALFAQWLPVFNSGDETIRSFYESRIGNPNPAYELDLARSTCGLDPVRVLSSTAGEYVVLAVERCFPALVRVTVRTIDGEKGRRVIVPLHPYNLSPAGAANYTFAAAAREAEANTFAGIVMIVPGEGELRVQAYGYADLAGTRPVTLDTPFLLASAGKMFTAVAVLQLVEQGKIDLNAPLGRYLPDYPNAQTREEVTIRYLLTHRDGTGDMGILRREHGENRARVRSLADIVALNAERDPAFEPGTQTAYGSYGMLLLGLVVEAVSGEDYYAYIQRHVFDPAGMAQAGFPLLSEMGDVAVGLTTFYGQESELVPNLDVLPWRGTPGGGGVASASDMVAFFAALKDGTLLSPAMLAQAVTPSEAFGWGLGFSVSPGQSWGHGGNSYGMDVAIYQYLPNDTLFVCLATRDHACNRIIFNWYLRQFGLDE
ncbi:serine hydrolase domain-containing protein [Aurantiacibacter flavus]|uniref:Serine hydrolase domain-containing protein n=1 Tax=Aurantiacibacter flavus TaxID=3145232 RepID=A0ABV0CU04_9SPHN